MHPVARGAVVASAVLAVLGLSGCGAPPPVGAATSSAGPATAGAPGVDDGAPHEAENRAYRDRVPLAPGAQRHLDAARQDVLARLAALHGAPAVDRVQAVLTAAGLTFTTLDRVPATGVVAFDAELDPYGCLAGTVPASGAATVDTAGFIADGGCHALSGH